MTLDPVFLDPFFLPRIFSKVSFQTFFCTMRNSNSEVSMQNRVWRKDGKGGAVFVMDQGKAGELGGFIPFTSPDAIERFKQSGFVAYVDIHPRTFDAVREDDVNGKRHIILAPWDSKTDTVDTNVSKTEITPDVKTIYFVDKVSGA